MGLQIKVATLDADVVQLFEREEQPTARGSAVARASGDLAERLVGGVFVEGSNDDESAFE
jgi:hypothetical protein